MKQKPNHLSVFVRGSKTVLVIAWDKKHNEMWRRNDPEAVSCWKQFQRAGMEVYVHYE